LIAKGLVDDTPIERLRPSDLDGYTQCHFFAGIGGWSLALRLAGWPDDRPVWTGSCPCQPFSVAGKGEGFRDNEERDLWPYFFDLIAGCRPPQVFGEQVSKAVELGDEKWSWLERLAFHLDSVGYEFGAAVFPACSIGAFHKRERLYFVADSSGLGNSPEEHQSVGDDMVGSFWSDAVWEHREDGKAFAVKPGLRPMVDGLRPGDLDLLRGAGNAIVPQQAAEFIRAFVEARSEIASPLGLLR
jgi:DNA (cytosine-5)-methyltransferase 1